MDGVDPVLPLFVGTALIVIVVLVDVVPWARVEGLGVQVAPDRDDGSAQVIVMSAGSVAPDGVRLKFICSA
jgi:hypothetical protein